MQCSNMKNSIYAFVLGVPWRSSYPDTAAGNPMPDVQNILTSQDYGRRSEGHHARLTYVPKENDMPGPRTRESSTPELRERCFHTHVYM